MNTLHNLNRTPLRTLGFFGGAAIAVFAILQSTYGADAPISIPGITAPAPAPDAAAVVEEATNAALSTPAAEALTGSAQTVELNLNTLWMVIAAGMVFLMQAGFCLLELGLVRAKNTINVIMKNFLDMSVAFVGFLFVGSALMFGDSVGGFIGSSGFWLSAFPAEHPFWGFWIFQVMFASAAATIASGAMAERTKFVGYLIFSVFMCTLIYPTLGHWVWGSFGGAYEMGGDQGWLQAMGFQDFAGSTVVHGVGGAAALAGIIVIGPRKGRFGKSGKARFIPGHSLPLAALGTFLLWFGWFGFNGGSTLVSDGGVARVMVNTAVAGAFGSLMSMIAFWITQGRSDLGIALNGALGGLVAVTASANVVSPAMAAGIGMIAGLIANGGGTLLEKLGLDDVVGAVPVHLFNGIWGTLCVALFNENGFSINLLGVQALGAFLIPTVSFIASYSVFKFADAVVGMRATEEEQEDGLDAAEHSANAYPDFVTD